MKNLILCLLLFGFISAGHSQILLKEAKVDYKPKSMEVDPLTSQLVISIPEKKVGEFQEDPLSFIKNKFDIQKLVKDNEKENFVSYWIHFKSNNGYLNANFKGDGTLVSSYQNFKNLRLPEEARLEVLSKFGDAAIVGNKYIAYSKGWDVTREMYKVKIKDGDKTRRLKINKQDSYISFTEH